jgi:sulfatase modifying factor 1
MSNSKSLWRQLATLRWLNKRLNRRGFPCARRKPLAGSLVFTPTSSPVPLDDYLRWWRYQKGANGRHPEGPNSNIKGRKKYPIVHVAYADAVAYAKWVGKRLST